MLNSILFIMGNPQQGGGSVQLFLMGGIILVFWLFMIRPQAKKQKSKKSLLIIYRKGIRLLPLLVFMPT